MAPAGPIDGPGVGPSFHAPDAVRWRAWLAEHHAREREIWLVIHKKGSSIPSVSLAEAVEEALCFGWIDGKVRGVDADRYALRFTPRRPDSVWSETNRRRVLRLTREGRMTEAGLRAVAEGKRRGQWPASRRAIPAAADETPADLAAALEADARARAFFAGLAPSYRRMYIAWVSAARRQETRTRRIRTVVERAARGRKPGIDL